MSNPVTTAVVGRAVGGAGLLTLAFARGILRREERPPSGDDAS